MPGIWKIESRVNSDFHLVYIKGGEGFYTVGGEKHCFARGKMIFVSRGMLHSARPNPALLPSIIPVRFGICEPVPGSSEGRPKTVRQPFGFSYTPSDALLYERLFEKMHRYHTMRENGYGEALAETVLREILLRLMMDMTEPGARQPDARLEKARQRIDDHPCERLSPAQMAEMAGMSEKYFRQLFKRRYGVTPLEHQIKSRMEYARFLLAESGHSVKKVALTVGYPDPYSFSKQFKQVIGCSPVQCRKIR